MDARPTLFAIVSACLILAIPGRAAAQDLPTSDCFGVIDYAHELSLQNVTLVASTPVGGGLSRVVLSAQLTNGSGGDFTLAQARPDLSQSLLGIVEDHPSATDFQFGPVAPAGTTPGSGNMTVVLPASEVTQLVADLESGALPVVVYAEETLAAAPGNRFGYLSGLGDGGDTIEDGNGKVIAYMWPSESDPPLMFGDPPVLYHTVSPAPGDVIDAALEGFDGARWFVLSELFDVNVPDSPLPEDLRNGQLRVTTVPDENVPHYFRYWFMLWDGPDAATDVADVFERGSFCTTAAHNVDPVDGRTRQHSIDGDPVEPSDRNGNGQGIRFNRQLINGVEVSGQVQGHAIRPNVQISVRPGNEKRFIAALETDLSFSVSLTAETDVQSAHSEIDLKDLCFPLPPLPLGPVDIPLSLHLGHTLTLEAALTAGTTLGVQKRVTSRYELGWDQRRPSSDRFFSQASSQSTPMEFTPPRLLDDVEASAAIGADLKVTLNVGTPADVFGECIAEAGPYIKAGASGEIAVSPAGDTFWTLSHKAGISGGLDMEVLGFSLIDQEAELVEFPAPETLSGSRVAARGGSATAGNDQRWAVNIEDAAVAPPQAMTHSDVAATQDGGARVISSGSSRLSAYDATGRYLWDRRFALGYEARDVFTDWSDTTYVVGQHGSAGWIAAYDVDGDLLFSREHTLTDPVSGARCRFTRAAMGYDAGQPTLLLVGQLAFVQYTKSCALRLDHAGQSVWAKVFDFGLPAQAPGVDTDGDGVNDDIDNCPWFANPSQADANNDGIGDLCRSTYNLALGASALSDGGFAIAGRMRTLETSTDPVIMRLDADGEVQWASGYYGRARLFNAVTEAFDGSLYMTGEADSTLNLTEAAFLAARISADGGDGAGTLVFGDTAWEILLDEWDNAPDASIIRSYYDGGVDLVPAPDGVVAVGHAGAPAANVVAGVAVKLNRNLGSEWHLVWDHGAHAEELHAITAVDGGYLVTGRSNSFNSDNRGSLLLAKLPYEGHVGLIGGTGYDNRFIASGSTGETGANQPGFASILFHALDASVSDDGPVAGLETASDGLCVTLLSTSGAASGTGGCNDDGDPFVNAVDNCTLVDNPQQRDTDGDGYGNYCDPDFNNDLIVNSVDLGYLKARFFTSDPDADMNGDGAVNVVDLGLLRERFFQPPGPSGQVP